MEKIIAETKIDFLKAGLRARSLLALYQIKMELFKASKYS